jgi:hypothetical protein
LCQVKFSGGYAVCRGIDVTGEIERTAGASILAIIGHTMVIQIISKEYFRL